MTTLRDVAKIADVNISTISRYLSGQLAVTPETEQRIIRAIQQTGYQPNIIAQSLRKRSSPTVAVIVPDIFQPGISGIVSGIDDKLINTEYTLITMMTKGSAARELSLLSNLHQRMVAGVIVVGHPLEGGNDIQTLRDTIGEKIPMVFVSRHFTASTISEVCPNQEDGALKLTQHLIDRGYRSIGIIVGSKNHPDAMVKLRGYRKALSDNGLIFNSELVEAGFYQPDPTRIATQCLLQKNVDAIFCTSDLMAVSAAQYIHECGLSIPGDVAVAGYGGTIWADIFSPKLTTVVVHVEQLGGLAIELLMYQIHHPDDKSKFLVRPVYLHMGATT